MILNARKRGVWLCLASGLVGSALSVAHAALGSIPPEDRRDYEAVASTRAWSVAPSGHYRLFLDVYNNADYYDSEPGGQTKLFADRTLLTDTIRPVMTVLWDQQFRFQAGVIAQRTYGDFVGYGSVDPWVQLLWRPISSFDAIAGDLNIPHDYLPAIFYAPNYVFNVNHEEGLQLLNLHPNWRDDLFVNYHQIETANQHELIDFGFTHHNDWKFLNLTYQAHWQHQGGDNFPHPDNTINDTAQAVGIGIKQKVGDSFIVGGNYYYLHSHYRVQSDTPGDTTRKNGDGHYFTTYVRYSRLKLTYGHWHGNGYSHGDGDQYFQVPNMEQAIVHYDMLISEDFSLFAEVVGYFVENNSLGIDHYVKPTFWIQASWHFAIPSKGWSPGEPPSDEPRWDFSEYSGSRL
jgi:hypothetical protein